MRPLLLTVMTLCNTSFLVCGTPMYVSLCNAVGLSEGSTVRAQAETRILFEAAGVEIFWVPCDTIATARLELGDRLFVVRLLGDAPAHTSQSVSLEAMGRAYTSARGSGYLADAYVHSVNDFAKARQVDRDALLGLVISHELGHVLLGPGHVPEGIMSGTWKSHETAEMRKRWLRFQSGQAELVKQELEKRAAASEPR